MFTLIVGPSPGDPVTSRLARLIPAHAGDRPPVVVGLDRVDDACRADRPDVVVVVVAAGHEARALAALRRVEALGSVFLLAAGPAVDSKLILQAMQAGADLFLDEADLGPQLAAALGRYKARRGEPAGPGRLVAVLAAAGGCGASTIAVNLATLIARSRGRCNLIDLNPRRADLAPLLDLTPTYTLADLCRNEDRLDRTLYEKLLTPHPSGVELLAAPREFEGVAALTPGVVGKAVRLAREAYADVVVDLEDCFHREQAAVLDQATTVLLVCRLDFTAVRNTRRVLDHLAARGVPRDRVEVVANFAGRPGELPVEEAEMALGAKVSRLIPHDPDTVGWSNNTGLPAALTSPAAAVVQSIARIVGLETTPARLPLVVRVGNGARAAWAATQAARTATAAAARTAWGRLRAARDCLRRWYRDRARRSATASPPPAVIAAETTHDLALDPQSDTALRSWAD
jgi:pilus assembly protein CpaE